MRVTENERRERDRRGVRRRRREKIEKGKSVEAICGSDRQK